MLGSSDLGARSSGGVVTAGPWTVRDSYIAETAVTLDRLTAKIERLERREEALKSQVAELTDHAQQTDRFQVLAESLRNSRDYTIGEVTRQIKELRGRVDGIEGPRSTFATLTHKSFIDIDRKLAELAVLEARTEILTRRAQVAQFAMGFLTAAMAALMGALVL